MRSRRDSLCIVVLLFLLFAPGTAPYNQTLAQNAPSSEPSSAKAQSNQTTDEKKHCTNNGTYVNSEGQTVKRPESCSSAPKGATAQCRDGEYSFSSTRRGTCSHHGGVLKWL
jgi:hypothetical protein